MLNGTKQVRILGRWKSDAHMYHIGYDAAASSDASTAYSLELEPTSRNVRLVTSLQQTSTNYWSTCLENPCAWSTNEGYSGHSSAGSRFTGRWCNPPCVWKLGQVLKEIWSSNSQPTPCGSTCPSRCTCRLLRLANTLQHSSYSTGSAERSIWVFPPQFRRAPSSFSSRRACDICCTRWDKWASGTSKFKTFLTLNGWLARSSTNTCPLLLLHLPCSPCSLRLHQRTILPPLVPQIQFLLIRLHPTLFWTHPLQTNNKSRRRSKEWLTGCSVL